MRNIAVLPSVNSKDPMALMSLAAFQEISTEDLISSARSVPGGTKFISRIASRQLRSF
jgi:hypothetical protein